MKTCAELMCEKPNYGKGLCKLYYERFRRYGRTGVTPVRSLPLVERFHTKYRKRGEDECWLWLGTEAGATGYGVFARGPYKLAHRAAYLIANGPDSIPEGFEWTIDHTCRTRLCVNPNHLELVTRGENTLRGDTITAANRDKTHCLRGHPFDEENTYRHPRGNRVCRQCQRDRQVAR